MTSSADLATQVRHTLMKSMSVTETTGLYSHDDYDVGMGALAGLEGRLARAEMELREIAEHRGCTDYYHAACPCYEEIKEIAREALGPLGRDEHGEGAE